MIAESVSGEIIGEVMIAGELTYKGRVQGRRFYAETMDGLRAEAHAEKERLRRQMEDEEWERTMTTPEWMIRIHN